MRYLRYLLLPFSLIYGVIVRLRNFFYDRGFFNTFVIPGRSVCVGNISVGGTGKSPMTAYLADLLLARGMQVAILSRGYGRQTKGLRLATNEDNAQTIGDEPFMYYRRFAGKNVSVTVAEERKTGVTAIREKYPDAVILLDDAFQHRKVKAGLQLVLTTFGRPLFRDFVFPAGNLREPRSGLRRADAAIVTKCPESIDDSTKRKFISGLGRNEVDVFFSRIVYGDLKPMTGGLPENIEKVMLVTGIADPKPLEAYLRKSCEVELMQFADHHAFTSADLDAVQRKIDTFASVRPVVVTTEKDAVRLIDLQGHPAMSNNTWLFQSMTVEFDRENKFNELILKYVTGTDERSS
jgi:tetraacyldisaccharide 4'-kinase